MVLLSTQNTCLNWCFILAHQIGTSAVFTYMRKFYLTYPYQPVGKIKIEQLHVERRVTSLLCCISAYSRSETFVWGWDRKIYPSRSPFAITRQILWARKRIYYSYENGIEKSVPRDHHLSSLGKPRDANRWSSGQIFLSHSYIIIRAGPYHICF